MERVASGRRSKSIARFRWSVQEPKELNDVELAVECGAIWEGDELVTYDMGSRQWRMEHLGDDCMNRRRLTGA